MGLDFSHSNAHWSYSGFNRFRSRLARQIGFDLDDMEGFGGFRSFDEMNDSIKPLLDHSDCDGELTSEECRQVAPRLRELVKEWNEDDRDKIHALDLADGMEYALNINEPFEFC